MRFSKYDRILFSKFGRIRTAHQGPSKIELFMQYLLTRAGVYIRTSDVEPDSFVSVDPDPEV